MNIKSMLAKPFSSIVASKIRQSAQQAVADQENILKHLLKVAPITLYGRDHKLESGMDYNSYKQAVPIRDYEGIKTYIEQIKQGIPNVLWKGKPIYFAKTSGTTSGVKYIPITKDSIHNHINTARNALLNYMAETGNRAFADGKMIFLSGSPELERVGGIPTGRLSGIVNHHIPAYLRSNQLPTFTTNCIDDWETKLEKIVEETIKQDMRLISGIPPWMQMYFDKLVEKTGKSISALFPNFSVMVQGGVNFAPYKKKLFETIGKPIDTIELFPASEGFFAFTDKINEPGLLLNTNSGIFFEFIPLDEFFSENPSRLSLKDVQLGVNYVLIINSNAGLWGYNIGDTVKFVSVNPYKIVVSGRVKHYISAFGEHVIAEEVEQSIYQAATEMNVKIVEFTVAPNVSQNKQGKSYHEWFIEFEDVPQQLAVFASKVDQNLRAKNVYYDDLITGHILDPLVITPIRKSGFIDYMKSIGKLGGQNKVPRLSNDRKLADDLVRFAL